MSLRACPDCGRRISTKAERCPNCGWSASRPTAVGDPTPFLLSAAEVRRRKVKCRECGEDVSLGGGACPSCGYSPGGGKPSRWKVLLLLVLLTVLGVSAVAWKLGLLSQQALTATSLGSAVADSAQLETELRDASLRKRRDPPRIQSSRFQGSCLSPAPVFVYGLDRVPTIFLVRLAPGIANAQLSGDSLQGRYKLETAGYEARWNAVFAKNVSAETVAKLRCDPAVGSIEEVAFNDSEEIRLPRMNRLKRFKS